ncbi:uncharacterized protein [Parasteatoda tepidariorum]|uniref:uncharacterized protein n=1 Tax=Parasteatoda tepidariorum TaxID=114398 RepID=UPI00077FC42C|nr:uncharacterized protein LOC107456720 [Parasteatoda tepidariorum]XP_042911061.1 uncharacterized protein LOC107456720 [Parasteatoda tepidariorum]
MRYIFLLSILTLFIAGHSSFRLAIRLCFKDTGTATDQSNCAYCNPKTLLQTLRNCTNTEDGLPTKSPNDIGPGSIWSEIDMKCVLDKCKAEYPEQRVLPTLFPILYQNKNK